MNVPKTKLDTYVRDELSVSMTPLDQSTPVLAVSFESLCALTQMMEPDQRRQLAVAVTAMRRINMGTRTEYFGTDTIIDALHKIFETR